MPANTPLLSIVDDDADVRIALVRLALSAGFAVESFGTGTEFLLSVEHHRPDCVVLDLHMPGMSGFEVQSALARYERDVPVVVITGHDTAESRNRARDLGVCAFLVKPVDDDELLAAIEGAMTYRRARGHS